MKTLLSLLALGIAWMWSIISLDGLHRERTDITAGQGIGKGKSWIGWVNIYNPANYTERGQRLLAWHCVSIGVFILTLLNAARVL